MPGHRLAVDGRSEENLFISFKDIDTGANKSWIMPGHRLAVDGRSSENLFISFKDIDSGNKKSWIMPGHRLAVDGRSEENLFWRDEAGMEHGPTAPEFRQSHSSFH
jgi:TctA family transporter